jgi:hypothetical protein
MRSPAVTHFDRHRMIYRVVVILKEVKDLGAK